MVASFDIKQPIAIYKEYDMLRRKIASGFTLIELLVVVSIIALLVSILLPALSKARDQARKAVCASNLHQFALAEVTYAEGYNGYLPYFQSGTHVHDISRLFFEKMQDEYGLELKHFLCPGRITKEDDILGNSYNTNPNAFYYTVTYCFLNPRPCNTSMGLMDWPPTPEDYPAVVIYPDTEYIGPRKLSDKRGITVPIITDDVSFRTSYVLSKGYTMEVMESPKGQAGIAWDKTTFNHRRGDNMPSSQNHVFIDGHVENVDPYDLLPRMQYGSGPTTSIWW